MPVFMESGEIILSRTKGALQKNLCRERRPNCFDQRGLTLIELMVLIAIIGILAAITIPSMFHYRYNAQVTRTIAEMKTIEQAVFMYKLSHGHFPESLDAVGWGNTPDIWGNPYQYTRVEDNNKVQLRKNKSMVPVNTDFDLYSTGKSGRSSAPFTSALSKDDVVRANDGGYFGLVSNY